MSKENSQNNIPDVIPKIKINKNKEIKRSVIPSDFAIWILD
ncbi:MAG: hypothetical protein V3U92_14625 [Cellulophaga sp.]